MCSCRHGQKQDETGAFPQINDINVGDEKQLALDGFSCERQTDSCAEALQVFARKDSSAIFEGCSLCIIKCPFGRGVPFFFSRFYREPPRKLALSLQIMIELLRFGLWLEEKLACLVHACPRAKTLCFAFLPAFSDSSIARDCTSWEHQKVEMMNVSK